MLSTLEPIDSTPCMDHLTDRSIAMDLGLFLPESPIERYHDTQFVVSTFLPVIVITSHAHFKDISMAMEMMTPASFKLNHPDRPSSALPGSATSNHRLRHELEALYWVGIDFIATVFKVDPETATLLDYMAKATKEVDIFLDRRTDSSQVEDLSGDYVDLQTIKACVILHISGNNLAIEPRPPYLEDFFRDFARLLGDSTGSEDVLIVEAMKLLDDALGKSGPNKTALVMKAPEDGRTTVDDSSKGAKKSSPSDV